MTGTAPGGGHQVPLFGWRLLAVVLPVVIAAVVLWCLPPIPQAPEYHDFADQRPLLGIPHCLNVVSNIPFVVVGVWGLAFLVGPGATRPGGPFQERGERWPYGLFFLGIAATGFGSAYYHLHPDTDRLVWDRLPMTLAFMGLFAAVIGERIDQRAGLRLLLPLVAAGAGTVLYWHRTEGQGRGDLRPYVLTQFYPLLAIPLMLLLFPARYTRSGELFAALGWYVVAKACEGLDGPIFALGHAVSGHTLKHVAAAAGAWQVLHMLGHRRPVSPPVASAQA